MTKLKHGSIRVYFYVLFALFFFSGGLSLILLLPLYKGAFAPGASLRALSFFPIWKHFYKMIWRSLADKSYNAMFSVKLCDPPILHNDPATLRIRDTWPGAANNCDACALSCCAQINCPMLKGKCCLSYGSLFFGYFNCGMHPANQAQIDRYNCPKWEVKDAS
jgi:hypothetical protein